MQDEKVKEQVTAQVPVSVMDDPAELVAGQDRELLNGLVDELCEFFGLGKRALSILHEMDVIVGAEVAAVNMNKVCLLTGAKTARRIGLLKDWVIMKRRDIAGPPGLGKQPEVKNCKL